MKLSNNVFKDTRQIKGFTQEEILNVKSDVSKFKAENTNPSEIDDYLSKKLLTKGILEFYTEYITQVDEFDENYLKSEINYYTLKSEILKEIEIISNNIVNVSLNCRNVKRFLKNNVFLEDLSEMIQKLLDKISEIKVRLEDNLSKVEKDYDNHCYLWIETNKIKNLTFKLNKIPEIMKNWQEIKELSGLIAHLNEGAPKKRKKEKLYRFNFLISRIF